MWMSLNSISLEGIEDPAERKRLYEEWIEWRNKELFDVDIPEFTEEQLEDLDFTIQLAIQKKKEIKITYVLNRCKHHIITKVHSFDLKAQRLVVLEKEQPVQVTLDHVIDASFQFSRCGCC